MRLEWEASLVLLDDRAPGEFDIHVHPSPNNSRPMSPDIVTADMSRVYRGSIREGRIMLSHTNYSDYDSGFSAGCTPGDSFASSPETVHGSIRTDIPLTGLPVATTLPSSGLLSKDIYESVAIVLDKKHNFTPEEA